MKQRDQLRVLPRRAGILPALIIALLAVLSFVNTARNDFVFDDTKLVLNAPVIRNLANIPSFFTMPRWLTVSPHDDANRPRTAVYRPLVLVSLAVNYALDGLDPRGYHIFNVVFHAMVAILVFYLALGLGCSKNASLLAGVLFAVHPIHVDAVAPVAGRAEILMGFGFLLALVAYIRARENPNWCFRAISLGGFLVALLSKEQGIMLPAVAFLYDVFAAKHRGLELRKGALARYLPYLLILAAYFLVKGTLREGLPSLPVGRSSLDNPLVEVGGWPRFLMGIVVSTRYLWLFVWPQNLSADYSFNAIPVIDSPWNVVFLAGVVVWACLLCGAAWSYTRGSGVVFWGIGFFVLLYVPVSNWVLAIGTIMAERLFYMPSAGLLVAVAGLYDFGIDRLTGESRVRRYVALVLMVSLVGVLMLRTILRNQDWQSNETLFRSAVRVVPDSAKVHFALGLLEPSPSRALLDLEHAHEIFPRYTRTRSFNLAMGSVLLRLNRAEEAVTFLERTIALGSRAHLAFYHLGLAYTKLGQWKRAEGPYQKVLALDPNHHDALNNLSFVLWQQGRYREALASAERALEANPESAQAHYNRGRALELLGHDDEAIAAYRRALELRPIRSARERIGRLRARIGTRGRSE